MHDNTSILVLSSNNDEGTSGHAPIEGDTSGEGPSRTHKALGQRERFDQEKWAAKVERQVSKLMSYLHNNFSEDRHGKMFQTHKETIMEFSLDMKDRYIWQKETWLEATKQLEAERSKVQSLSVAVERLEHQVKKIERERALEKELPSGEAVWGEMTKTLKLIDSRLDRLETRDTEKTRVAADTLKKINDRLGKLENGIRQHSTERKGVAAGGTRDPSQINKHRNRSGSRQTALPPRQVEKARGKERSVEYQRQYPKVGVIPRVQSQRKWGPDLKTSGRQ